MADVRINGKRVPALQPIANVGTLVTRIEALGQRDGSILTALNINNRSIDLDSNDFLRLRVETTDKVEAMMETSEQLSLQSLQVARDMAELLVFDLKVATLSLWDNTRAQQKSLETLLCDCKLFLELSARPIELLGRDPERVEDTIKQCLQQLDKVANNLEDAVLLAINTRNRDACHVLVARVLPSIEEWLALSDEFAQILRLDRVEFRFDLNDLPPPQDPVGAPVVR